MYYVCIIIIKNYNETFTKLAGKSDKTVFYLI